MAWAVKHPEVVYTDLDDGVVLLHLDTKFYYSLNEVGAVIWRLLDTAESIDDNVRQLMTEYDVDERTAETCLSSFLQTLERESLVFPRQDGGTRRTLGEQLPAPVPMAEPTKRRFSTPELVKHDEPLHEVVTNPFDPQLPLAE